MLKIAIVGCGKVADQHVAQIRYTPDCKIVGVCDQEELMARQLQERLGMGVIALFPMRYAACCPGSTCALTS